MLPSGDQSYVLHLEFGYHVTAPVHTKCSYINVDQNKTECEEDGTVECVIVFQKS